MAVSRLTQNTLQSGLPKFDSFWDGRSAVGSMEPITGITLTSSQSTINFNNIPGTYSHLQIRSIVRDTGGSYGYNVSLTFNSDSTSSYSRNNLEGNGSSVSASGSSSAETSIPVAMTTGGTNLTNNFAVFVLDILDYANTNKNTTCRCLLGYDDNGSGYVNLRSGCYLKTDAITTIRFASTGTAFAANSSFTLYGIK
jgi:hypothetical protein